MIAHLGGFAAGRRGDGDVGTDGDVDQAGQTGRTPVS
jgi:hypothetical protein